MKLFKTVKTIVSKEGVLHFKRFAIIECSLFNIYIHRIYHEDEEKHMHDHPWDYVSVLLRGKFIEKTVNGHSGWIRPISVIKRKAEDFHKIQALGIGCSHLTTLFFTGKRRREWGYDTEKGWIDNVSYRKWKHEGYK